MFCNHTEIKIQHSLIIGCGGRGTEAVSRCQELILNKVFRDDKKKMHDFTPIQCLCFDSTEQHLEEDNHPHSLATVTIAAQDNELNKIVESRDGMYPNNPNGVAHILKYMPDRNYARMIRGLPNSAMGNSTCPALGAINFLGSWERIKNEVKQILGKWKQPYSDKDIKVRSFNEWNQIFIAAGLYGGTGSGIHLHLTAMLRVLLKEMEIYNTAIYAFFILPDVVANADNTGKRKLRANAYACLKEIDYFVSGNPFVIHTGTGQEDIIISNTSANDVLFNKIFLINNENIHHTKIDQFEASHMIGEMLFNFSSSSFGEALNQHLTDTPHEYCSMEAPESDKQQIIVETRQRAYSTFGLATVRIPYEILKNNLIADCAIEIMNSCIQIADDDSEKEQAKLEKEQLWLNNKYINNDDPLIFIKVNETLLNDELDDCFPLPDYMLKIRGKNFAEYIKRQSLNLKNGIERIIEQTEIIEGWEDPEGIDKLLKTKKHEIELFQDKLFNEGAGPVQTVKILQQIRKMVGLEIEELNGKTAGESADDHRRFIYAQIEKIRLAGEQKSFPFLKSGLIRETEKYLKKLKVNIGIYRDLLKTNLQINILKKLNDQLSFIISKTDEEAQRFQLILEHLENKRRGYEDSKLLKNAVKTSILNRFIQRFPYSAGSNPDDLADNIQQNGLFFKKNLDNSGRETIMISEFPDYPPEDVADALYEMAKKNVEEMVPEENWRKSFTQSGLYYKPGVDKDWKAKGVDVKGYDNTMEKLIKCSAPYLEYSDSLGFDVCKENFFIYPKYEDNDMDVERLIWKKQTLPEGRDAWLESRAEEGNFSLTCMQFHYGIPLFSIDQFEEWKIDYDNMLQSTDRPLHKVDQSVMREPYLVTEAFNMKTDVIKELYDWLLRVSKDIYPAFYFVSDTPVLNDLEDIRIKEFYYKTRKKQFIPINNLKTLLQDHPRLSAYLILVLTINFNRTGGFDGNECFKLSSLAGEISPTSVSPDLIMALFDKLKNSEKNQLKYIAFKQQDSTVTEIWLSSKLTTDREVKEIINNKFYKILDEPEFKTHKKEDVLEAIMKNPWFQKAFWSMCIKARNFLESIGNSERLPAIFKEKE